MSSCGRNTMGLRFTTMDRKQLSSKRKPQGRHPWGFLFDDNYLNKLFTSLM